MHRAESSNGTFAAVSIVLIGLALSIAWLMLTQPDSAVNEALAGPLAGAEVATAVEAPLIEGIRIESSLQFSQPRDPFRPLITEESVGAGGSTDPDTDGTSDGTDDDTDGQDTDSGTTVTLQEIRDVNGTRRATVVVDGVSYDVGVGDSFAGTFMVVSLDETGGVFLNGDNAFELSVGQQILK